MDKSQVKKALDQLNKDAPKRKFAQKYDLVVLLKDLDIKTAPVDFYTVLHYPVGKKRKIVGIVDQELAEKSRKALDLTITVRDLDTYKTDPKATKKIAQDFDWVVAQANMMTQVATVFGRTLGPRGKMPNPKAGCVVPPTADMDSLVEKLQKTLRVQAKKMPAVQTVIGNEEMKEDEIIDNVITLYAALVKALPNQENNIRAVLLKKTMSKPVKV